MSAMLCGKRSVLDDLNCQVPTIAKRIRCGNSPIRFQSVGTGGEADSGWNGGSSVNALDDITQLRFLYPDLDEHFILQVHESCKRNLDSAIKTLTDQKFSLSDHITSAAQLSAANEPIKKLMNDNLILRKAVIINHDRQTQHEERYKELQALKHFVVQHEEQIRVQNLNSSRELQALRELLVQREEEIRELKFNNSRELQALSGLLHQHRQQIGVLELKNYALALHLREALEGRSIPGRFHPDLF